MEPRENAANVAVDDGVALVECDTEDRSRDISADTRQRLQNVVVAGNFPAILLNDLFCSGLKIPCPAIVSKTCPHLEDAFFGSLCECRNVGEFSEKLVVVGKDGFDLSLL